MMHILNQIKRLGYDNGQNDKDFTNEEMALNAAKDNLNDAISKFTSAARNLYDFILQEQDIH